MKIVIKMIRKCIRTNLIIIEEKDQIDEDNNRDW